ncbi:AMP-binding protein [Dasania marina]|uniref:AMP-binding protein n=1 Tax=Dasania marina TaxID=471499 RepID=UPI00036FF92C|nr:AMP-binding protein [Dasania marina]
MTSNTTTTAYTPAVPAIIEQNPIRSGDDWQQMRTACEQDLGAFHGDIAAKNCHWFNAEQNAWLSKTDNGWTGWNTSGQPVDLAQWTPWHTALDESDAPFYRWFIGGKTNAAFNEVDRHVLAGHGAETAFFYEGDRWDPTANGGKGGPVQHYAMSRRDLMIQSVLAAQALRDLGLQCGDRIAINMPNILEQIVWTEAAKRVGVIYTPVFGGFSDKTLSDRIENAGARIVITADGAARNAEVAGFKEVYTDPALDKYISITSALDILANANVDDALKTKIVAHVTDVLGGEITLSRAEVMREVGQILAKAQLSAEDTAELRGELAAALSNSPARVEKVVVVRHAGLSDLPWSEGRDVWAHDLLADAEQKILTNAGLKTRADLDALSDQDLVAALYKSVQPVEVDAEFPLFIIYTSGSTGKPKGVVHVHGGYIAGITETMKVAFDAVPGKDVMWVIADPGWITGQSYMISGALSARIPSVVTEGSPVFPHTGRFSSIIERYGVTIFKAGSTFLKGIMTNNQNRADVDRYDMSSVKVATFCAEPTSPSVQEFAMDLMTPQYINSYWATEHGGIVWTHPYGNKDLPLRADTHTYPLPWIFGDIWIPQGSADEQGRVGFRSAEHEEKGEIVIARPYPYLARTIWGDSNNVGKPDWKGDIARFEKTYFGSYRNDDGTPAYGYLQGDFARNYEDGSFSLHGRSDDVINVSGHRMGTEEIEGAILKDKQVNPDSKVGNCIVIGAPHTAKGLTPLAFILPMAGAHITRDDERKLKELVREEKGIVAVPSDFITVSAFPETRSGKYMRRFLKAIVLGEELGDTTTLRNPECLDEIRAAVANWQAGQDRAERQTITETTRTLRIEYAPVGTKNGVAIRVATVTITNPPVNALSERLLDELETALTHIARRSDIGAVVLAGAGNKAFVAGADVRQLLEDVHDAAAARSLPSKAHAVANMIENMSKPVIAAVEGVALGGGCEMALACHLRVANSRTIFGQPEINLYLPPGYGGTQRLPRVLMDAAGDDAITGLNRAMAMLLSGRQIKGQQANEFGLVDKYCTGTDSVLPAAQALARAAALNGAGDAINAMNKRHQAVARWNLAASFPAATLDDDYVQICIKASEQAGRGPVAHAIVGLVKLGFEQGFKAGLNSEIDTFAKFVMDEENGGKKGIQLFMDKQSPALPSKARKDISEKAALIERGDLLPMGAPYLAGITPIPSYQLAKAVVRDAKTGAYCHGDPIDVEEEVIIPVPQPEANEALVYMLTSELNYNDIWAITGIPISLFDEHDEDIHVTGSGGIGIVAKMGEGLQGEGRLAVGKLVVVYSGVSDVLDPAAGVDPMFTDFHIQGYQSPDGSHQQFMICSGPQMIAPAADLSLETAGSYMLPAGTAYRALFRALELRQGDRMFVEGAASGTGAWSVELGIAAGAKITGMVSSEERCEYLRKQGSAGINRKDSAIKDCFSKVPVDAIQWAEWQQQGEGFLQAVRAANDGELCTHGLSHAGETAFPRSFQALGENGVMTYFGASSGYHMTFIGKPGSSSATDMLRKAKARPGQATVIFYGSRTGQRDNEALAAIEAGRASSLRIVVVTDTDAERDFVMSLGFGDAVLGAVSLTEIRRREPEFDWPDTMGDLPNPESPEFKECVRLMNENTLKPIGKAVGKLLRSEDNPRGQPDIIIERAHTDSLFATTMMVKPHTGIVIYAGDMGGKRYSFYAPQVWMRQRSVLMPTASIVGTHLCNAAEILGLNQMIDAGAVQVPEPYLGEWDEMENLHQAMWENRLPEVTNGAVKTVINHALPMHGLKSMDELLAAWAEQS